MASPLLDSITSETDSCKLSVLYQELFKNLQGMKNTFEEDNFLKDNIDQLIQLLIRDTNNKNNNHITSNVLYHIIPCVGYILNLLDALNNNNNNDNYDIHINKLFHQIIDIISNTDDLELCIRCIWMFKSLLCKLPKTIKSFLPLFYETCNEFLFDDTNRFLSPE